MEEPTRKAKGTLRRQAEEALAARMSSNGEQCLRRLDEVVHELEVHQIELELQNKELQNAQVALQEARDRYRDLYEQAPVAYLTIDWGNTIREANAAAGTLLGSSRLLLLNTSLARYIFPPDLDRLYLTLRSVAATAERQVMELGLRRADGEARTAEVYAAPAAVRGQFRIALVDITARKQAEQLKDDFISMVSHELRTPLTVLIGNIRVAESAGLTPAQVQELIHDADLAAGDLQGILENLVQLSRYQAGKLTLNLARIDLGRLLARQVDFMREYAPDHRFALQVAEGLPAVEADESKIAQVLNNLLTNAVKYSPAGTEVTVGAARADTDLMRVSVADQGAGIAPRDQAKLFQPFERLKESRNNKPGLGLGLLVSRRLVEAHGGKIWAESAGVGKGAEFAFTLPITRHSHQPGREPGTKRRLPPP